MQFYNVGPPDIDEGSHASRPSIITRGNKRVKIGTPVYVYKGFDVIIDCKIVYGTPPITIKWFRNGSPDPTRGNVSTITITDASNGDVFKCRADNNIGFDTENTTIHVECGKCVVHILNRVRAGLRAWFLSIASVRKCLYTCVFVCVCVCVRVCVCVCPPPRLSITSGVIWCDIDPIRFVE